MATTPGEVLADGWSLVIFPEGTRSKDGWIGQLPDGRGVPGPRARRPRRTRRAPRHLRRDAARPGLAVAGPAPAHDPVRRAAAAARGRVGARVRAADQGRGRHAARRGQDDLVGGPPPRLRRRHPRPVRPAGRPVAPGLGAVGVARRPTGRAAGCGPGAARLGKRALTARSCAAHAGRARSPHDKDSRRTGRPDHLRAARSRRARADALRTAASATEVATTTGSSRPAAAPTAPAGSSRSRPTTAASRSRARSTATSPARAGTGRSRTTAPSRRRARPPPAAAAARSASSARSPTRPAPTRSSSGRSAPARSAPAPSRSDLGEPDPAGALPAGSGPVQAPVLQDGSMAPVGWLERYRNGDRARVWLELRQLGLEYAQRSLRPRRRRSATRWPCVPDRTSKW